MAIRDFTNSIITKDGYSKTFKGFDSAVEGSGRKLDKLGGIMSGGGLAMLFGATAGVAGAVAIGKTVWALGELGAESLTTKASFDTLMRSVGAAPGLLDSMKASAGGTITELQLMQSANTALAGTSGQLSTELAGAIPRLIEAGRAAALLNPAMGDAAFMTQSLITGIKRGSPMLIDNTGITLKLGEATEAYAKSVGKSVAELTAQERSIAILRATLEGSDTLITQVGGSLDSMTSDIQSSKVAVEELKTAFAELFAPGVADFASNMALGVRGFTAALQGDEMARWNVDLAYYTKQLKELEGQAPSTAAGQRHLAEAIATTNGVIAELQGKITAAVNAEIGMQNASEGARFATHDLAVATDTAATASATFTDRLAGLTAMARGSGSAMQSLIGYINGVSAAASGGGSYTGFLGGADVLSQSQYVAATQQRINVERNLNVEVAAGIISQMEADYQLQQFDNSMSGHLNSLRDAKNATVDYSAAVGGLGETASAAESKLKGLISQKLAPTFDLSGLTGGLLGGGMGDSFDEAYKRLAAVALRPEELQIHGGDWAATFEKAGLTGLSPEDAQARAKELVEAYSKGLDFSLIDTEAIKDSVRQAIRAEDLYNSIVDEIYDEMGKENPKLQSAGEKVGNEMNKGLATAGTVGVGRYLDGIADRVEPILEKRLRAKGALP